MDPKVIEKIQENLSRMQESIHGLQDRLTKMENDIEQAFSMIHDLRDDTEDSVRDFRNREAYGRTF